MPSVKMADIIIKRLPKKGTLPSKMMLLYLDGSFQ